jgi:hypothetical protein
LSAGISPAGLISALIEKPIWQTNFFFLASTSDLRQKPNTVLKSSSKLAENQN